MLEHQDDPGTAFTARASLDARSNRRTNCGNHWMIRSNKIWHLVIEVDSLCRSTFYNFWSRSISQFGFDDSPDASDAFGRVSDARLKHSFISACTTEFTVNSDWKLISIVDLNPFLKASRSIASHTHTENSFQLENYELIWKHFAHNEFRSNVGRDSSAASPAAPETRRLNSTGPLRLKATLPHLHLLITHAISRENRGWSLHWEGG